MITQPMSGNMLVTKLIHVESKEELTSELPLGNPEKSQDLGSRITYLRRYQIVSMLGLTIEDDTDARPVAKEDIPLTPKQAAQIEVADEIHAKVSGLGEMPPHDSVVVPAEMTEGFKKAKGAIDSCMSLGALEIIADKVKNSTKLNEVEKEALAVTIKAKDAELMAK